MSVSKRFKEATGMTVPEFAKKVGLPSYKIYTDNRRGYCCYPYIPRRGQRSHSLFATWKAIRSRCRRTSDKDYPNYGGRGITMDVRWNDFFMFLEDMGDRPPGHQIDREDNSKGYSKENCRWVTREDNCRNTRTNRYITWGGVSLSIAAWVEILELPRSTINNRISRKLEFYSPNNL